MIPIGSRVRVNWGGRDWSGIVALHGVSKSGEPRILVWFGEAGSAGQYKWFSLERLR